MTTIDEERVTRALDRIEARLLEVASSNWRSAVLAASDPSIVLPSPGVGLLGIRPGPSARLEAGTPFCSTQAIGTTGEIEVETMEGVWVQPFRVAAVSWLPVAAPAEGVAAVPLARRALVRGFSLALERTHVDEPLEGELSLWFETGDVLADVLSRAKTTWNGRPVRCRSGIVDPRHAMGADVHALHSYRAHLDALGDHRLTIDVPEDSTADGDATIEIRFAEPFAAESVPQVRLHAVSVWNSSARVSPDPMEVGRNILGADPRSVHVLHPRPRGGRWRAWHIENVASAQAAGRLIAPRRRSSGADPRGWHLAFLSSSCLPGAFRNEPPVLAVVLDHESRRQMDLDRETLQVTYFATTGTEAEHVRVGDEFARDQASDRMARRDFSGEMLTRLLGATDGIDIDSFGAGNGRLLEVLLPQTRRRTVGETQVLFDLLFGRVLELVNIEDLLRPQVRHGRVSELTVRVRFHDPTTGAAERRSVLRAATVVLGRYLRLREALDFRLVDVAEPARVS